MLGSESTIRTQLGLWDSYSLIRWSPSPVSVPLPHAHWARGARQPKNPELQPVVLVNMLCISFFLAVTRGCKLAQPRRRGLGLPSLLLLTWSRLRELPVWASREMRCPGMLWSPGRCWRLQHLLDSPHQKAAGCRCTSRGAQQDGGGAAWKAPGPECLIPSQ